MYVGYMRCASISTNVPYTNQVVAYFINDFIDLKSLLSIHWNGSEHASASPHIYDKRRKRPVSVIIFFYWCDDEHKGYILVCNTLCNLNAQVFQIFCRARQINYSVSWLLPGDTSYWSSGRYGWRLFLSVMVWFQCLLEGVTGSQTWIQWAYGYNGEKIYYLLIPYYFDCMFYVYESAGWWYEECLTLILVDFITITKNVVVSEKCNHVWKEFPWIEAP